MAERFAGTFGMGEWGRILGLLHDKGKEQRAFQQHIRKDSGYDENAQVDGDYTHAYVGALLAHVHYEDVLPFLAYPIMGHHAGLHDYIDYEHTLEKKIPKDVSDIQNVEKLHIPEVLYSAKPYMQHHIIRMLFSCLVDADFLDTEGFMTPQEAELRKRHDSLADMLPKLESYLLELNRNAEDTKVNGIRRQIQEWCVQKSSDAPGFYSLTVPTGGGKTLSSILWAMKHAVKYGKNRIIIAIPFTSIVIQTAETLRSIFGANNVLEHHSNTSFDRIADKEDEIQNSKGVELAKSVKLATENWDYPIVVTTNVQLFESVFANKPSKCRKLHNLCNSVIILDEAQTLPTAYLQPIVNSLVSYQQLFGVSVLFMTASQPVLEGEHHGVNRNTTLRGIDKITEIIPADARLYDSLRRVELHFDDKRSSYDEIAKRVAAYSKVLCVVNTRKDALEIFKRLPKEENGITLHLSRMMCPKHIGETIDVIKRALSPGSKVPVVRVVSTQLIEAGVDVDFDVVFRQEAGLDSILQAAGRCNREGKQETLGQVYVFKLQDSLLRGQMNRAKDAFERIRIYISDFMSPQAMREFFLKLYQKSATFDKQNKEGYTICNMLEEETGDYLDVPDAYIANMDYRFAIAAKSFRLIDDQQVSVIVNFVSSEERVCDGKTNVEQLIDKLLNEGITYSLAKELNQYTVNIREKDYKELQGALMQDDRLPPDIHFLPNRYQYDEKVGLVVRNLYLEETFIIDQL